MNIITRYFIIILTLLTNYDASRITLVQRQACRIMDNTKEVLCQCREEDSKAYLGVRMQGFVMKAGETNVSLVVDSCPDLILNLDLRGLNLSRVSTVFRNSDTLSIESIILDSRNAEREVLKLQFYRIKSLLLTGVKVHSQIKLEAVNVQKFQLLSSSFANLPTRGLVVNGSARLEILDCVFEKVHFKSIVVERTRSLTIVGNQFGGSGLKILSYRDSSSASIHCNRVLGTQATPECERIPTVPSVATEESYNRYQHKSLQELVEIGEEEDIDWGVIVLGTVLLISILIYTTYMSYHNQELLQAIKNQFLIQLGYPIGAAVNDSTQDQSVPLKCSIPDPPPPPDLVEAETVVNTNKPSGANGKTQVLSPIWLNEIQSNKIFNKHKKNIQNNENSEDEIKVVPDDANAEGENKEPDKNLVDSQDRCNKKPEELTIKAAINSVEDSQDSKEVLQFHNTDVVEPAQQVTKFKKEFKEYVY